MEAHQQRVVDEKTELDEKLDKLNSFIESNPIFGELPNAEKDRLNRQEVYMSLYSKVLGERIEAFLIP